MSKKNLISIVCLFMLITIFVGCIQENKKEVKEKSKLEQVSSSNNDEINNKGSKDNKNNEEKINEKKR